MRFGCGLWTFSKLQARPDQTKWFEMSKLSYLEHPGHKWKMTAFSEEQKCVLVWDEVIISAINLPFPPNPAQPRAVMTCKILRQILPTGKLLNFVNSHQQSFIQDLVCDKHLNSHLQFRKSASASAERRVAAQPSNKGHDSLWSVK